MQPTELQTSLHERIPLSRAMGVTVPQAEPTGVVLSAPLAPNVNHSGTVFGGSAAAVPPSPADWERLLGTLQRGRMGRIAVRTVLDCEGERVGELEGEFAVIPA